MTAGVFIYALINVLTWIGIVALCFMYSDKWTDYLIYPLLWNNLDSNNINTIGKIIVCILFTLLLLPAILMSYAIMLCYTSALWMIRTFCKVCRKK